MSILNSALRILDENSNENFSLLKSEFQNPSCHLLYETLCELISLELFATDPVTFTQNISKNIINMFFIGYTELKNKNFKFIN